MARPPVQKDPFEAIAAALPDFDREEAVTLRQMAMRDPLPGCPMEVQIFPGADPESIEPGQWLSRGAVDGSTGLPIGCPVIPLGMDGQTAWFLNTLGAVVCLEAGSSGKGPIGALFGGRSRWLEWAWPRWSKINDPSSAKPKFEVIGWQADDARQALFDACAYRGAFSLEDQVRGRGAWRDDVGGLIYHAGDEVYLDGRWRPCGAHGDFIYPRRAKIGRPVARKHAPGRGSAGDHLLELLRTFSWERGEMDAQLMLGWVMTAKMGGALIRRPVAFVTGPEGSGKSVLHGMLRLVMNGALIKSSNTTQAGIYQKLREDSIAIMIDEMEAAEDTRIVQKILELARIAYSGDSLSRGGQNGTGRDFTLRSSFLGSSIAKPATDASDDSRMACMNLRERETAGGRLDVDGATLDMIGRQLMRRIFDHWSRWDRLCEIFRKGLIDIGHSDRACDTFAPLCAGAHLALSDDDPSAEDLARWAAWLDPRQLTEISNREKTWRRCLTYLLEVQPAAFASPRDTHKSVGQILDAFRNKKANAEDVNDYLRRVGLAFSWPAGQWDQTYETGRLFVPAKHPALNTLFEGTPWAGRPAAPGPWGGVLRQMPKPLFQNGKSDKGLDQKLSGLFINLAQALEA